LSGVFEGKTTGTPISILIPNQDANSSHYEPLKHLLRPGHANATYLAKYGLFDYRGGGRASARETACRVAAGAVARKLLAHYGITLSAYLAQIGDRPLSAEDPLPIDLLNEAIALGDSLGGIVAFTLSSLPAGLGDPIYEKLEANLAKAMLSLPASKGFEIGSGFSCAVMRGSEHNDLFESGSLQTTTNHAGGTLGGISTGMPLVGKVAFKPTSSIRKPQATLTTTFEPTILTLPEGSRHDPCVAIRAVPVVEAMAALVIADALLLNRCATL
jgi:chorismate synthase